MDSRWRRAHAQATAQITGTVTDPTGGVLPGASVTATQTETGFKREVASDAEGYFALPGIPVGPYRLEVALQGFRTSVQTGIVLLGGSNGALAYSLAGGLAFGVTFVLDGAMRNDPRNNLNLPLPFPDALQECRAETNALSAQNGMHSSGAVNVVTKSGTNAFRGNVFEFFRHHRFNATSPFATRNADGSRAGDGLRRNQYGGTSADRSRPTLDLSLTRIVRIAEMREFEVRVDAFNALNWLRWGQPATSLNNLATFGQITTAGDPRVMQFAIKHRF